jgi:hypothetical protein
MLADAAIANAPILADMKRVVCSIGHSLSASKDPELTSGLILLMATISRRSALVLSPADFAYLKEEIFMHCGVIIDLCTTSDAPEIVLKGISIFHYDFNIC